MYEFLGHPEIFRKLLTAERLKADEGLLKRFVINHDPPAAILSDVLMGVPDLEFKLSVLFLFMKQLNEYNLVYKYNDEAHK